MNVQVERTGYREAWIVRAQDQRLYHVRGTGPLAAHRADVPLGELVTYIVTDLTALAPPMESESPTADRIEYTLRVHARYHIPYEVLEVLPCLGGIVGAAANSLGDRLERLEVAQEPGEDGQIVVVEACVRGRLYLCDPERVYSVIVSAPEAFGGCTIEVTHGQARAKGLI